MLTNPCLAHRTLCSALGFIKRNFKKKEGGEGYRRALTPLQLSL